MDVISRWVLYSTETPRAKELASLTSSAAASAPHGEVGVLGGRKKAARHDELPSAGVCILS